MKSELLQLLLEGTLVVAFDVAIYEAIALRTIQPAAFINIDVLYGHR